MNYVKIIKLSVVFIIFVILACTPKAPATAPSGPGPSLVKEGEQLTAKEAWEKEWDNTLKAAKKEGSVIIYASTPAPAFKEAINIFRQKYGISLDVITGRGAELRGKLMQERTRGLFLADAFASGLNSIFGDVKPVGAADSLDKELILPEVKDPKVYYEGKLPWADEDHRVLYLFAYPTHMIGINSEMVKPGEIKSYHDLLDPKWKGKIIINDPTITGTPFNGFATLLFNKVLDIDFFRQLVSQQTAMIQDQRLQVDWLARGKYPVGLWPRAVHMAEYQQAGTPVAWVEAKEGTYLSMDGGGLVLVNKAPHPNAARILINWALSKEGQSIIQNTLQTHAARIDISTEGLDPAQVRKPGAKYFLSANVIEKWVLEEQDKYLELAKQVFGPLKTR